MPKKVKKRLSKSKVVRRKTRVNAGKIKKKILLLFGIVIILLGLVFLQPWKFVAQQVSTISQGPAVIMPKPDSKVLKNITLEPDKAKTVFLKTANGTIITLEFPIGTVDHKTPISIATAKDETGVFILPDGKKFLRPVSITFDLTKTSLRSDAPDKIDETNPRRTGTTNIYSIDSKGKVTPTFIARGMETSVLVPGKTLIAGVYVLRTNDTNAQKYAKLTLNDPKSYYYSVLQAASTLLGNNQTLTKVEQANAKDAVQKVLSKKSAPLYELYAAVSVNNYLQGKKMTFIPYAYADDNLETQLQKMCSDNTHSTETYVNAELLAKMQGFTSVAQLCRQTGDTVLRQKAQELFDSPSATFDDVMIMIGQVKSIEGTNSTLLTNMENKLKQVVDRDMRNVINNPTASPDDIFAVYDRMAFTTVDPTLEKKLDRVTFMDARQQIEKILAEDCAKENEILYAKSLVIEYQLDDLKDKVNNKNACQDASFDARGGNNPPPPGGGGGGSTTGGTSTPEVAGTCFEPFEWSYNMTGDNSCEVCYDVVTNDNRLDKLETRCEKFVCSDDTAITQRLDSHKCSIDAAAEDVYNGKYTDPSWQPLNDELPLEAPPPNDGPPIPDTLNGDQGNQDSSSNNSSDTSVTNDGTDAGSSSDTGSTNDSGSSNDGSSDSSQDPNNPLDVGLQN